jgi:hypothetical protein
MIRQTARKRDSATVPSNALTARRDGACLKYLSLAVFPGCGPSRKPLSGLGADRTSIVGCGPSLAAGGTRCGFCASCNRTGVPLRRGVRSRSDKSRSVRTQKPRQPAAEANDPSRRGGQREPGARATSVSRATQRADCMWRIDTETLIWCTAGGRNSGVMARGLRRSTMTEQGSVG